MSTQRKNLTRNTWTNLGSGPLFVETPMLSNIAVAFGETSPDVESQAFHALHGPDYITYEGTSNCYAKALNDAGVVIYTFGTG